MEAQDSIKPALKPNRFGKNLLSMLTGIIFFLLVASAGTYLLFSLTSTSSPIFLEGLLKNSTETPLPTSSAMPQSTQVKVTPTSSSTTTRTPFQPQTFTPTVTLTPTPTATFTSSPTPSPTITASPTYTPVPPSPTPQDELPIEASTDPINGYAQTLPLSCESRSAVDFAAYFGILIGEMDFQYGLPSSDNPNTGFVGDPRHERGFIPPSSYGVHAAPVAALLRAYGLNAYSYSNLSFDDLRREIASGQPVIAWVIGNVWRGSGTGYTASDGETMIVAPFEHTVIVTGYSLNTVQILDGNLVYTTTVERFLDSWQVLGNMAIIVE